jgi:hypothetical protein
MEVWRRHAGAVFSMHLKFMTILALFMSSFPVLPLWNALPFVLWLLVFFILLGCLAEWGFWRMDSGQGDRGDDVVARAVRAAEVARQAQKKAERAAKEALDVARRELKRPEKMAQFRKAEARKKTMSAYFMSSRGFGSGQPLSLVLDSSMPDVPGAEPNSREEYPSDDNGGRDVAHGQSNLLSVDTEKNHGSSSTSGDTVVLSAKSPLVTLSEDSEEADADGFVEVPIDFEGSDSDFQSPPSKRHSSSRKKARSSQSEAQTRYDKHRKFQTVWAAKLPWAEGIMATDGILHMVKCKVCSSIDRKPCVMAPKSDTLFKHDGKRTARKDLPQYKVKAGQQYVATQCKHRRNMKLYAAKAPTSVLEQINNCTSLEAKKKRVQFATLFQLLSDGRPMLEFQSRVALYKLIGVPDLPSAHWCDSSGWIMAGYIYKIVLDETRRLIANARYVAVTVDEVTAVDNSSFLSIHAYIVQNWVRIPLLISLLRVECAPTSENLTELIVGGMKSGGGLHELAVAQKVISFGADGASALQGCRVGVTQQVKDKHAPSVIGVHCVAHRCNLAFKGLSNLGIFAAIEKLLSVSYGYFCKSPKRFSEFRQLAELTNTKGLKMLKNVQTRWVSLIEPLRRLLSEYRTLIYKMTADLPENNKAEVRVCFI